VKILSQTTVPVMGKLLAETLISLQREGRLFSGSWTCPDNSSTHPGVDSQIRAAFEASVEKIVNGSKYSAVRDKV
jgi:hypothetical protein